MGQDTTASRLSTIIAAHTPQPQKVVLQVARDERRAEKIDCLLSALMLAQHDPATRYVIQELQRQKAQGGQLGP